MLYYMNNLFWWILGYEDIDKDKELKILNPQLKSITQYYKSLDEKKNHRYYFNKMKCNELYL